jgi:SM-20-related protein
MRATAPRYLRPTVVAKSRRLTSALNSVASPASISYLFDVALPGVYCVYDASGVVQYCGIARSIGPALQRHAAAFAGEPSLAHAASVFPSRSAGASSAVLQEQWREVLATLATVPPGNAPGADPRWTEKKRTPQTTPQARPTLPPLDVDASRWRSEAVDALISSVSESFSVSGYAVIDGVLSSECVTAAKRACEALEPLLAAIPSQAIAGRNDLSGSFRLSSPGSRALSSLGRASNTSDGEASAALADVSSLLMALPHALQLHLLPPQCLQLALYRAGGHYSRHLDNPGPEAEGALDGPPGWRTSDRALTGIVYLNGDWKPADGGALRLWPPALRGDFIDIAPLGGRLLLFDSCTVEHEVLPSAAKSRWALSAWIPRDVRIA